MKLNLLLRIRAMYVEKNSKICNLYLSPCTTKNHPLGYSLVFSVVAGSYNASIGLKILNLKDDLCEAKLLKKPG